MQTQVNEKTADKRDRNQDHDDIHTQQLSKRRVQICRILTLCTNKIENIKSNASGHTSSTT